MKRRLIGKLIQIYEYFLTFDLNELLFKVYLLLRYRKVSHHVRKARFLWRRGEYQNVVNRALPIIHTKRFYPHLNLMKMCAHAYRMLNQQDKADRLGERILLSISKWDAQRLLKELEFEGYQAQFMFLGGAENISIVIHKHEQRQIFTKVLPFHPWFRNLNPEVHFYTDNNDAYMKLKSYVPAMLRHLAFPKQRIACMSTEFVVKRDIDFNDLNLIMEYDRICRSIPYQAFACPKTGYQAYQRHLDHPWMLALICSHLEMMLKDDLKITLTNLRKKALKLSRLLRRDKDYCFNHNDFHKKNVFVRMDGSLLVLDWNTYGWALKGSDLSNYLSHFDFSMEWLESDVLNQLPTNDRSPLQNWFFVFLILYRKQLRHSKNPVKNEPFIMEAMQWLQEQEGMIP